MLSKTAFSIAALIDSTSDLITIPLEYYFIDYVQALFIATGGAIAAGYYQNKLRQQEEMQRDLSASLINATDYWN